MKCASFLRTKGEVLKKLATKIPKGPRQKDRDLPYRGPRELKSEQCHKDSMQGSDLPGHILAPFEQAKSYPASSPYHVSIHLTQTPTKSGYPNKLEIYQRSLHRCALIFGYPHIMRLIKLFRSSVIWDSRSSTCIF